MPKRLFTALAAIVLLLSGGLACNSASVLRLFQPPPTAAAPSGTPHFYLARDQAGTAETNEFAPNDTVYILIDARGLPAGTVFDVNWYGVEVFTADPNTPLAYHTISHDGRSPTVEAWFGSANGLGLGRYRVDVYQNGEKIGEKEFTVR